MLNIHLVRILQCSGIRIITKYSTILFIPLVRYQFYMTKLPCYHALALCDKKTLSCLLTNPISMSVRIGDIAEEAATAGETKLTRCSRRSYKDLLAESRARKESINYSEGAGESSGL